MQYDEKIEDESSRKFKQVIFFLTIPFFAVACLLASIAALPFYMLYKLVVKPCDWISNKHLCWEKRSVKKCIKN